MQKHPMLSVKEAAEALRIDERSVRDRLTNGTLKGEKKMVGLREKWFIYSGAVQSALAKQDDLGDMAFAKNPESVYEQSAVHTVDATSVTVHEREDAPAQSYRSPEHQEVEDATYGDLDDVTPRSAREPLRGEWRAEGQSNLQSLADAFMKPLLDKVAAQERALVEQASLLQAQQKEIEEQKIQLRLLPNLEKLARDEAEAAKAAELKLHEAAALKKQAELLAENTAKELAWKETLLIETEAEIKTLKTEKEEQAKAVQEQLLVLTQRLEKLDKPWWKRIIGAE